VAAAAGLRRDLDPRQVEHEVGEHGAEAATDHLHGDHRRHLTTGPVPEHPCRKGDRRVEVRRDGPEDRDDGHQHAGGSHCVLQQLEPDVVRA
ncbi:uncharacterized protein METZ01_LOCUS152761, partial [marine metagenome]